MSTIALSLEKMEKHIKMQPLRNYCSKNIFRKIILMGIKNNYCTAWSTSLSTCETVNNATWHTTAMKFVYFKFSENKLIEKGSLHARSTGFIFFISGGIK